MPAVSSLLSLSLFCLLFYFLSLSLVCLFLLSVSLSLVCLTLVSLSLVCLSLVCLSLCCLSLCCLLVGCLFFCLLFIVTGIDVASVSIGIKVSVCVVCLFVSLLRSLCLVVSADGSVAPYVSFSLCLSLRVTNDRFRVSLQSPLGLPSPPKGDQSRPWRVCPRLLQSQK